MRASSDAGGSGLLQCSQVGLNSSTMRSRRRGKAKDGPHPYDDLAGPSSPPNPGSDDPDGREGEKSARRQGGPVEFRRVAWPSVDNEELGAHWCRRAMGFGVVRDLIVRPGRENEFLTVDQSVVPNGMSLICITVAPAARRALRPPVRLRLRSRPGCRTEAPRGQRRCGSVRRSRRRRVR